MSTKLKSVTLDGFVWLVAVVTGTAYFLHKQSRVGDRMRPGQRLKDEPHG